MRRAANDDECAQAQGRLAAEVGYGLQAFGGRFTGPPYAAYTLSETARGYTLGGRFAPAGSAAPGLTFGIKATRQESDTAEPDQGVRFEIRARW